MSFRRFCILFLFLMAAVYAGCKKPYIPPVISNANNYLVVEGLINSGQDSTIIFINRTLNLDNSLSESPVLKAIVTVESDQNAVFALKEMGNGKYASPALNIDKAHSYRVHIITSDNREYKSDLVPVQTTPPIDSVGFSVANEGMVVYANTHDATNAVQYYRYSYEEAWEFHAFYNSQFIARGHSPIASKDSIVERGSADQIYYCFNNDVSSDIVLGSTAKLKQGILFQNPIATVSPTSEKVEVEYSILVHQYALTADGFKFWTELKKNTEQLGSIFDAQPSQTTGNIHCISNPAEPVIGYISANDVQSKRIFVHSYQLPPQWLATYPYSGCSLDSTLYSQIGMPVQVYLIDSPHLALPITFLGKGIGYLRSTYDCADCTIRGKRDPPPFWKY